MTRNKAWKVWFQELAKQDNWIEAGIAWDRAVGAAIQHGHKENPENWPGFGQTAYYELESLVGEKD